MLSTEVAVEATICDQPQIFRNLFLLHCDYPPKPYLTQTTQMGRRFSQIMIKKSAWISVNLRSERYSRGISSISKRRGQSLPVTNKRSFSAS